PKVMSGRLAGMKFMQRAGGSPTTPSTPNERPTKKQRLSSGSALGTPSTPIEEQKRAGEIEAEGHDKGETKWYLSFQALQTTKTNSPLRVVSAGYSAIDSRRRVEQSDSAEEDDEDEGPARPTLTGRRSFGKFNRKVEKQNNPDAHGSASEDADEDEEDADIKDDPTGVKALIAKGRKEAAGRVRAERKAKGAADSVEAQRLARDRRGKGVILNKVTSISSGGGSASGRPSPNAVNMICHNCGNKGHVQRDCPQK
ncbi:hypothetical protein DOTSEDRAFT_102348, partial [Dothistroma septosporum NZE10]